MIISLLCRRWDDPQVDNEAMKRDPYAFGLGKRSEPAFGLGKRDSYAFGLGKRDSYAFGLGKRYEYSFSHGKRIPYAFGLGKRSPDEIKPYQAVLCVSRRGNFWCGPMQLRPR